MLSTDGFYLGQSVDIFHTSESKKKDLQQGRGKLSRNMETRLSISAASPLAYMCALRATDEIMTQKQEQSHKKHIADIHLHCSESRHHHHYFYHYNKVTVWDPLCKRSLIVYVGRKTVGNSFGIFISPYQVYKKYISKYNMRPFVVETLFSLISKCFLCNHQSNYPVPLKHITNYQTLLYHMCFLFMPLLRTRAITETQIQYRVMLVLHIV